MLQASMLWLEAEVKLDLHGIYGFEISSANPGLLIHDLSHPRVHNLQDNHCPLRAQYQNFAIFPQKTTVAEPFASHSQQT